MPSVARRGAHASTIGSTMHRRHFLNHASAALLALLAGCASAQTGYTISLQQLQQALAERFPRSYPLAGLLDLELQAPHLTLLPERDQINARFDLAAFGPLLSRRHMGLFDVDFALRYEPTDRSIRAYRLHVNTLRIDGLRSPASELLQRYGQQLADQSLREVVLHQLRDKDLAPIDRLGLQPESISVTPRGLLVRFGAKPLS
ncbi:MAG: DUF1439 domain-containing protein [Proteobacteria bacterium]|nr:DUF1439 domain-containing protein [Pseudomonadota bacterium]